MSTVSTFIRMFTTFAPKFKIGWASRDLYHCFLTVSPIAPPSNINHGSLRSPICSDLRSFATLFVVLGRSQVPKTLPPVHPLTPRILRHYYHCPMFLCCKCLLHSRHFVSRFVCFSEPLCTVSSWFPVAYVLFYPYYHTFPWYRVKWPPASNKSCVLY